MANTSAVGFGLGGAIVGGIAGFLIGTAIAGKKPVDCTTPTNRTIIVNDNGSLSCPDADVGPMHRVTWRASGTKTLKIVFDEPNPFPQLVCQRNQCDSFGFVDPDPNGTDKEPKFKYSGSISTSSGGTGTVLNGRIIIHK